MGEAGRAAVNIPNFRRLLAALREIEAAGQGSLLDMRDWYKIGGVAFASLANFLDASERLGEPTCHTTFCLAGLAQTIGATTRAEAEMRAPRFAQRWLHLDDKQASKLFYGVWPELPEHKRGRFDTGIFGICSPTDVTAAEAIRHLELMLAEEAGVREIAETVRTATATPATPADIPATVVAGLEAA